MKIKYKTLCAGPHGVFKPGDIQDGDEKGLMPLVEGGYAEVVKEDIAVKEEVIETADLKPEIQKAVKRNTTRKTTRKG